MKRNKITGRVSDNVRPARAKMSKEQVEEYFHNLQLELDGVVPKIYSISTGQTSLMTLNEKRLRYLLL